MSEITILSYNLWFHKAFHELPRLIEGRAVDVLALQECKVAGLPRTIGALSLVRADLLDDEIGLATYANRARWRARSGSCHSLPNTTYEKVSRKTDRTRLQLLGLISQEDGKRLVVGNAHIANLMSGNRGRQRQAVCTAELALEFAGGTPVIMTGDFNYPFAGKGLERFTRLTQNQ